MIIIPATLDARRTRIIITYAGKDISTDIAPYLLSFTFTDNAKDKADDIALTLEDRAGVWLRDWTPTKGDTIKASIVKTDGTNTTSLPCGSFSVDQIDYSYPPAVMAIKAVSSDVKASISKQKHTRMWENVKLRDIASDLAGDNSLTLFMTVEESGTYERIDQVEQTDLEFLKALCDNAGLAVKIQQKQLVIYDVEEYESKGPVTKLGIDDARLISFRFTSKTAKVYKKARVKYHHPVKDEVYIGEYEDDDEEGSERVLEICERVESEAQAKSVAQERLIATNRQEVTGSLTMTGDIRLAAGVTIELSEFGAFSGKHFVNKVTHNVNNGGYTCTLELGLPKPEKGKAKKSKQSKQKGKRQSGEVYYEGDRYYS